jgi:hypothetical protein
MPIVRRKDGSEVKVDINDVTRRKYRGDDGRLHMKLDDGTDGIVIWEEQLEEEKQEKKPMRFVDLCKSLGDAEVEQEEWDGRFPKCLEKFNE